MIRTSREQLISLFTKLGLRRDSVVMVHSALFSLGQIEGGVDGFYQTLMDHIGPEGTLIVPTFTYSFRRSLVFDKLKSPVARNIGIFAEYVRNQENVIRSSDPLFSMAAIGPRASELMERTSHYCFGEGSIYERLFNNNINFIGIGISYSTGLTGFLHLEKLANVNYRKDKRFLGVSIDDNGKKIKDYAIHFALQDESSICINTNREPIGIRLENHGVSTAFNFAQGKHISLRGHIWLDFVLNELKNDLNCMIENTQ